MNSINTNGQFQLKINILEAFGLQRADRNGSADPYVVAKLRGKPLNGSVKTSQIKNNLNPQWNQELSLYPKSVNEVLVLKIYDHDSFKKNNFLGMVEIPLNRFFQQGQKDTWLQLMKRKAGWKRVFGQRPQYISAPGQIHIQLWFDNSAQSLLSTGQASGNVLPTAQSLQQEFVAAPVQQEFVAAPLAEPTFVENIPAAATLPAETIQEEFTRANLPGISSTPSQPIITDTVIEIPSEAIKTSATNYNSGYLEVGRPEKFSWYQNPTTNTAPTTAI